MIPVKEEFLTEDKTKQAIKKGGCEAVVMWLAIKGYVARKNTAGFVPDEAIDTLPGAPKHPRKALQALVDCGLRDASGQVGAGLVDPHPFGWMLHDYEDHGTSQEVEQERRDKARAQKAARRAELARQKTLRDANVRGQSADKTPDSDRTESRTRSQTSASDNAPDSPPYAPRPPAHTSGPTRAPQPSPAQPSPKKAEEEASSPPIVTDSFAMHGAWAPTGETIAGLQIAGVGWGITEMVGSFRVHFMADQGDVCSDSDWNQRCAKWVLKDWRTPGKRPEKPTDAVPAVSAEDRRRRAAELEERARQQTRRLVAAPQKPVVT